MSYHLECRIVDQKEFHCRLSTSGAAVLTEPVLCFSIQAPSSAISACKKIEGLGGFTALRLDGTLAADTPLEFVLGFENRYFVATNRAWFPQGPYLRLDGGTVDVGMDIALGVDPSDPPDRSMPASGLALVPAPQNWRKGDRQIALGQFSISGTFQDAVASIDALAERHGLASLSGGDAPLVILQDPMLPASGYRLHLTDQLQLEAADDAGAVHGLISLLTLRETQGTVPSGIIEDAPRFEWRGFMLDCVREFYPVDAILKLLDLQALLKMNRFHWHFADDEAFRVELDCAPDLAAKSGFRGEGEVLPGVFGGRPGPTGGVYSKDDIARVIGHAAALAIEVLPEIEVPAHALALTAIRPEMRDADDTGSEVSVQGYARNVVNPEIQAVWDLLEPLSLEVAKLFPFGHLHLGGDELPERTWEGSPLVDAYKARHDLETHQDVQGHLMHRLAGHLVAHGISPCAWQEAADGKTGGIGHDAILFSWTGAGPGREAAARGYRVVMCPAQHTYFDMAHTVEAADWGANWAANYDLDHAFDWEPVPSADVADKILGVEGTFWSEFTSDACQYEAMIAPRIFGLASRGWSAAGGSLEELRRAVSCYAPLMEKLDWDVNWAAVWRETPKGQVRREDA